MVGCSSEENSKQDDSVSDSVTDNSQTESENDLEQSESSSTSSDSGIEPTEPEIVIEQPVPTTAGTEFYVTISSARTYYEHLGEQITIYHEYNGTAIPQWGGGRITATDSTITINTTITEQDSIPDVAYGSVSFSLEECQAGCTKVITIRVNENGGRRYPGAYALYDVTYTVEPLAGL
jgi:hypothetical protein